jgi:hypothetical protein
MVNKILKTIIGCAGVCLIGIGAFVPQNSFGAYQYIPWYWGGSFHCSSLIKGGGNLNIADASYTCNLRIYELAWSCVNPAGNSSNAGSFIFDETPEELTDVEAGDDFITIKKNGSQVTDVDFLDEDFAGILPELNVAELCPNGNWNLKVVPLRVDVMTTINRNPNGVLCGPENPFTTCNPDEDNGSDITDNGNTCAEQHECHNLSLPDYSFDIPTTYNSANEIVSGTGGCYMPGPDGVTPIDIGAGDELIAGTPYVCECVDHRRRTNNGQRILGPDSGDPECLGGFQTYDIPS